MSEYTPESPENSTKSRKADYIYQLIETRQIVSKRAKNYIEELKALFNISSMDDAKKLALKIFQYLASFIIFMITFTFILVKIWLKMGQLIYKGWLFLFYADKYVRTVILIVFIILIPSAAMFGKMSNESCCSNQVNIINEKLRSLSRSILNNTFNNYNKNKKITKQLTMEIGVPIPITSEAEVIPTETENNDLTLEILKSIVTTINEISIHPNKNSATPKNIKRPLVIW